jgi:RNase H-like domain found in reverse transcriptase
MGPWSNYNQQTIPDNKDIRQFVFKFATTLQELLAHIKESGATIAGQKAVIAMPRLALLGAIVSKDRAHVSHEINAKLSKWPSCRNSTDVQGFLGTVGVVRQWIENFAIIVRPLTLLTHKMAPTEFKWMEDTQQAMDKLKYLAATTVPIRMINYRLAREVPMSSQHTSDYGLVSITVDSSPIGCGWIVSQQLEDTEYPIIFGSLTFNKVESRYLQPKLELFGVFRALTAE